MVLVPKKNDNKERQKGRTGKRGVAWAAAAAGGSAGDVSVGIFGVVSAADSRPDVSGTTGVAVGLANINNRLLGAGVGVGVDVGAGVGAAGFSACGTNGTKLG